MPTAPNGSFELVYETFGVNQDPVIVCLPGMGNQLLIYPEPFCMALVDRGFYVIRMDLRDAGLSTATDGSVRYTLSDMADDVVAMLDHADVESAVVLGLSLGGMVAQQVAIDYPERTRALVSVSSTTREPELPQATDEVVAALVGPSVDDLEEQLSLDIAARKLWSNPEWFEPDAYRAYMVSCHERARVPGGGLRQLDAAYQSPVQVDELASLDVPTLVVHGTADTLLSIEHGRRTAELIPRAELLEIDGMSHDFVYQMWPALIEAVTALVASTFDD